MSLAALLGAVYTGVIQYPKFRLFGGMNTPVLLRSSGTKVYVILLNFHQVSAPLCCHKLISVKPLVNTTLAVIAGQQ
jgi:hypothetical protein